MKTSSLIAFASAFVRSRKFKVLVIGLQLGFFLVNSLAQDKVNNTSEENKRAKGKTKKKLPN